MLSASWMKRLKRQSNCYKKMLNSYWYLILMIQQKHGMGKYPMLTAMAKQLNPLVLASISPTTPPPRAIGPTDVSAVNNLCRRQCGVYVFHVVYSLASLIMCVESVFKILKMRRSKLDFIHKSTITSALQGSTSLPCFKFHHSMWSRK